MYDEICIAADGGMRARVRVLRGSCPVSDYKKDCRDMAGHAFVGGLVGGLLGMLAGPAGASVGAALGAYVVGKPRARELNRRAQQDDEGT